MAQPGDKWPGKQKNPGQIESTGEQGPPPLPFLQALFLPPLRPAPPRPVPSLLFPPRKLSAGWSIGVSGRTTVRTEEGGRGGPARVYAATGKSQLPGAGSGTLTGERAGPRPCWRRGAGGRRQGSPEAPPHPSVRWASPRDPTRGRSVCGFSAAPRDEGASVGKQGLYLAEPRSATK
ncbi:cuticle collagen 2C-like [Phodopus roborovskii]|uniref:cuticle collagen 2C-like n=1 Tax=Phodopus roborovskii TaxID=109678 RepID=UPI0021E3C83D|nr:cuticle collagen 2C-like [Phodopus roborovskii]